MLLPQVYLKTAYVHGENEDEPLDQWIGFRFQLQVTGTPDIFAGKIYGFRFRFSQQKQCSQIMFEVMIPESKLDPVESLPECLGHPPRGPGCFEVEAFR